MSGPSDLMPAVVEFQYFHFLSPCSESHFGWKCTCPRYLSYECCKHVIHWGKYKGTYVAALEHLSSSIDGKQKRGRKKKDKVKPGYCSSAELKEIQFWHNNVLPASPIKVTAAQES